MNVLTGYNGIVRGLTGVRAGLLLTIGCCAVANVALAVDPKLADEVESANQMYVDGDYQAALDAYTKAQSDCPECAELAYNQGLTHYRLGDLAKAREQFNEALSTNDTTLEAKAKYNLGNVAYSEALSNQAEPPKAIQSAQNAIDFYRDALELRPNDRDARANIETANRFLKKLQQQQQQQQNQDQQQQDQQKDQDQKQDQQKQDQQNQEQKNNDQQNDEQNSDQQQNDQQNQQQDEQDQQQKDEQSKEGEDEQQQDQDQQQQQDDQQNQGGEQDQQQADSADQQGQSQQPTEAQDLTEEEAERLLQAVRDKEAKRREQLAERRKAQRVTVDKDW